MHAHVELEQNKLPTCEGCSHTQKIITKKFRCLSKKRKQGKSTRQSRSYKQRERYKELLNTEFNKHINSVNKCAFAMLIEDMPKEDRTAVEDALAKNLPGAIIVKVLRSENYKISKVI